MATTEHEVLKIVGEKGKAGKTDITKVLGITNGYADVICKSLIREGYLKLEGRYYVLAPSGAKELLDSGWKLNIDRGTLKEIAKGVAKEVVKEIKTLPIRRRGRGARGVKEKEEEGVKIKTSFIAPIELEDVKMESNIERVTKQEKEKFDMGKAVEALKKVKK